MAGRAGDAADENDDDDFLGDDDALADLPTEALVALEQRAVLSTQQAGNSLSLGHQTLPTLPLPSAENSYHREAHDAVHRLQQRGDRGPSSDYGNLDDDDDVFDAELFDAELFDAELFDAALAPSATLQESLRSVEAKLAGQVTQREQWRRQRYGSLTGAHLHPPQPSIVRSGAERDLLAPALDDAPFKGRDLDAEAEMRDAPPLDAEPRVEQNGVSHDALQAQIQQLLQERNLLQQSLAAANSDSLSKAGEICIVRSNQAKASKEYERKLYALQKLHADEAARQRAELERAAAEKERIATDMAFLKRDLSDEGARVRNLQRSIRDGASSVGKPPGPPARGVSVASPMSTPRKGRGLPYRDGFDDDEIMASPSKPSGGRSKVVTPRTGTKRKRNAVDDSPVPALELSQPRRESTGDGAPPQQEAVASKEGIVLKEEPDGRYEFLQAVLHHRPSPERPRALDELRNYALPSAPDVPISSIILDRLSLFGARARPQNYPGDFFDMVASLWENCLSENYYKPLSLIMDFLAFVLAVDSRSIAPRIVDKLLPPLQATADINAIPGQKRHLASDLNPDVDLAACMSLLHLAALTCSHNAADNLHFWRFVRFDLCVMLLSPWQPLDQILAMTELLSTSVLEASFGPIIPNDETDQRNRERRILDLLCCLLRDGPRLPEEGEKDPKREVGQLRLSVLVLLSMISSTAQGGSAMAAHPTLIGRLVQTMSDELDALYDRAPGHAQSAAQVNLATRILHHLLTTHADRVSLQARLGTVRGGAHKHLVALTRLAFSEGLVLEAGIDDDVVACAHSILEECVTPEEGEALLGAFAGVGG
ncbi:MAG: hypothetical protein M1832_004058 [Thelocarpon impressellum]|nr:MAG: hypothetical protein M1832_004058 [Thelocarpon impressellum]